MYPQDFDDLLVENRADFEALDPEVKVAYCLHRLEAEVNNGGFYQFFTNSSGEYVRETSDALEAIGAEQTGALLKQAVQVCFPAGYPVDSGSYAAHIAGFDDVEDDIGPLDDAFLAYVDPLTDLVNEYLARAT